MPLASKAPMSGLKSVKRDYSQPALSQESIESDATLRSTSSVKKPLTDEEKRLEAITKALAGFSPSKPSHKRPLASSSAFDAQKSTVEPAAKRRQLPGLWARTDSFTRHDSIRSRSFTAANHAQPTTQTSKSDTEPRVIPAISTKVATAKAAPVFLSGEQTHILKLVEKGESVFYTGSAGTGKSVLLREIIKTLKKRYSKVPDAVAVTASTGIAACNIGGVTIHSFAGIGLGEGTPEQLEQKIRKNKKAMGRWLRTKALIVDEVSMVDGDLFDKLSRVGSLLRKKIEPFGGIQLVVTGDFFQLPPVTKGSQQVKFAFEADFWPQAVRRTFNLTKVFRQTDQDFVNMLNEMRFGRLSSKSIARFKALSREIVYEDGIAATELFPRREDVDRSNSTRMNLLTTQERIFSAYDSGSIQDQTQREKMLSNFMAPKILILRVNAQVMLIKNMDDTLVNGSLGKVVRFVDPSVYGTDNDPFDTNGDVLGGDKDRGKKQPAPAPKATGQVYPVVEFAVPGRGTREVLVQPEVWKVELPNGEVQVSRTQLPLILSWAMSIHKSQGQTLDRVKVDLGKVFEKGQAYVALSRATSLDGLQVLNFDPKKVTVHPKVIEWSKTLETITDH